MARRISIKRYRAGSGGWGSVRSLAKILWRERVPPVAALDTLLHQNKPGGFMCVSCAWPKPAEPHAFEFCENGAKATAWEITTLRCGPDFFAKHTLAELREWPDHDLEQQGRLTHPLRYDRVQDKYVAVSWDEANAAIGAELRALRERDAKSVVFYASGRASLETSYAWALFARMYGNNNLPDSSNMCHESTSVGLRQSLGVPVGTCVLDDFRLTDCIFLFGQNAPTNSPRFLHDLQQAAQRGVPIVVFNPLREGGLEKFGNPQDPVGMLTGNKTRIASHWYQVRAGGDIAAITGIAKAVLDLDDAAQRANGARVLDVGFIAEHSHGFDAYVAHVRDTSWDAIEAESGLTRAQLEEAARIYTRAKAVMGVYGMGLTQHRLGVQNVHAVCNLLLLRGNVGRPGAGASPVRGHSNVQGQRTVGIADRVALVPLDRLAEQYGFEPPREDGLNTVGTCEGVMAGTVQAFLQLGGNFLRAAPETEALERAWSKLRLTVHIATKLNRSHLVPGESCWVLPCLGRSERDVQASGPQAVSMEDSTSCIHGSRGNFRPAHAMLRSELRIVADLAKATLPPNPKLDWDAWVGDYAKVRDAIEQTYPQMFRDFNQRLWQPGGFHKGNAARERKWNTPTGKANFLVPPALSATGFADAPDDVLRLTTIRSNDQFNTTIYGYDDRFRGISGTRMIVMIGAADAQRLGVAENDEVALASAAGDGVERIVKGLRVLVRELPRGTIAAYYPECNPLIPVWHHAEESHVPAGKSVPVRILRNVP